MTLPDEGPEQRWRRTVRKRPAKLKLGRLLRDFGYAELDDDVAEAIEARMASVGLAVRPSLRLAAADEIVTVYRPQGTDDDAVAPASPAAPVGARAPVPAAAPEPPRPKPRRVADPDSLRKITDLKGQLADARAESARLRTELDGRIGAAAEAERMARRRLAEQSAVVEDQARRLAELSGLLNETRAALAEARDEVRRAVGDLPSAAVEAPVEDGGLVEEDGWLTDADEPLPPSPVEAAVSAVAPLADEPDEPADDADAAAAVRDEPAPPAPEDVLADPDESAAETDVFAARAEPAPDGDVTAAPVEAGAEEDVFAAPVEAADEDVFAVPAAADGDVFAVAPEGGAEVDVFAEPAGAAGDEDVVAPNAAEPADEVIEADASSEPDDLVFEPAGPPAEDEPTAPDPDDVFALPADPPAPAGRSAAEAEAAGQDDLFGPAPDGPAPDDDDVFGLPPQDEALALGPEHAPESEASRRSGFFTLEPAPDGGPAGQDEPHPDDGEPAASPPTAEMDLELSDWQGGEVPAEPEDLFDAPADGFGQALAEPVPEAAAPGETPSALPPPPPLPPSPFAGEPSAAASAPAPRQRPARPAKRGRMARGRGRWEGTCSVCERFPEVTRRKDLEAAGWQLDGDFPTCPQCRGLI